jgi:F5/8 type C domain
LITRDILRFYNRKFFSKSFFAFFCCTILIFSSSQINDNFTNKANAQTCSNNLPITGVTASGNDGNVPSNVLDNNLNTRWSNFGVGSWIRVDLGSTKSICSVDIAWYLGNQRTNNFAIATSTDGTTFNIVFSGTSSGTTLNSEKYTFASTNARYVRVTVNGNSQNNWASITELDVFGSSISSCTGTNLPISGATASGFETGYPPSNAIDNDFSTRWSNSLFGSWIRVDLGSTKSICSVDIAWFNGNQRQYHFVIATSTDGTTFTNKFSGDSSGTTLNSEKYTFASTNARYVRVTVNGNTQNNWATMYELDVFGSAASSVDQFGIKKLYPTKSGGEQWFMNMNNPLGDSRFNPQNTITKNPDGSWKMKSTKVRMAVYTSTGYDQDAIDTLDHSDIAAKGYMQAPNDWRNFEMTQYVKVNTSPSDDNFSPNGRGGRHTGDGPPEGCEGSSMKGDVFFSGKVRFAKEQWHVSYVFTSLKTATTSIEDRWVGIKFVVYNFQESGKTVVKTELWLDKNNNGNFVKVDENVDRGGWGTEGTECGGAPDQIISWGGPITTFRWDTATDVDFKYLSVREIAAPQ